MVFTGTDKSLLDRAARLVAAHAKLIEWERETDGKTRKRMKANFDALKRDERDLRALGKRLPITRVALAKPVIATAPFTGADQREGAERRQQDSGYVSPERRTSTTDRRQPKG